MIDEFLNLCKIYSGPIANSVSFDFKQHSGHIVFGFLIHGNETGAMPSILNCIDRLLSQKLRYGGKVSFFLGNLDAARINKRFIESDLNRCFGANWQGKQTKERIRALEITDLLRMADVFIDFHQTIQPTRKPFFIFEMQRESYFWARAVGTANIMITRKAGESFSRAGLCGDELFRSFGKPSITLELGEQGFHLESAERATNAIENALKCMDRVFSEGGSIDNLALKQRDFDFFLITHREPFSHPRKRLKTGFINLTHVNQGDTLGFDEQEIEIIAPSDGLLLFPQYPERGANQEASYPLPPELYMLAKSIREHPLSWSL